MAYYGSGNVAPGGSVFGGFAGGYNQTPEGLIIPTGSNMLGAGYPIVPGGDLSGGIDPTTFPGVVHYGPPSAVIEPLPVVVPISSTIVDPNLGIVSAVNLNAGF